MRPVYEAAVACKQADQIFNFSPTRTVTKPLLAPDIRGLIGIVRVEMRTLAIGCLRELEIRNFRLEHYFELVATATIPNGAFEVRQTSPHPPR